MSDLRETLARHFIMWHELPAPMRGEWLCECGMKFGFSDSAIDHQAEALAPVVAQMLTDERERIAREIETTAAIGADAITVSTAARIARGQS